MGVRISVAVLAACCVFCAADARAQGFGEGAPFGPPSGGGWEGQPSSFPPGPGGPGGPGMYPPGMPGGGPYGAPGFGGPPPGAIHPAGGAALDPYADPRFGGGASVHPEGCPCPECRQPSILERVWSMDAMLVNSFNPPLSGAWVRAEYLHWQFKKPGNRLMGSELSTVEHPEVRFPVFDLFGNQIGTGYVPTLDDIRINDNQGGRITLGVPLTFGDFEFSGLFFDQGSDHGGVTGLPGPQGVPNVRFVATSTFLDGQLSNNIQLWDEAFIYNYRVDVWGLDARVVLDHGQTGEGFHLKPIVGLKMLNVEENMEHMGVFTNQGFRPPQIGTVDAKTRNWLYGPVIGARAELEHRWFQVGIDPAVTIGLNNHSTRVTTENFAALGDPRITSKTHQTDFSPIFEVKAWLRVPLSENCSFFGGYEILHTPKLARAGSSVQYDVSLANPLEPRSAVRGKKNLEEWTAHGFMVGLEYVFP